MEATVTISYDVLVRRTVKVEAENQEIEDLVSMNGISYLQLPKNLVQKFDNMDVAHSKDVILGFPKNITVIADYDDPDEITINK